MASLKIDSDFEALYFKNNDLVLSAITSQEFQLVESIWENFWQNLSTKHKKSLTSVSVGQFLKDSDTQFYQRTLDHIIGDVFQNMTVQQTKKIRSFAKQIEVSLKKALSGLPDKFITPRLNIVASFSQKLRRYTGLNHLAQAARAVLVNPQHMAQLLADYARIDFAGVYEQVGWACEDCDLGFIKRQEEKFRNYGENLNRLETWSTWMQQLLREFLEPFQRTEQFRTRASEFLLRWSFISSLIIRDLTLRSAASFGMFHLMRLLCDEYMYYLVEKSFVDLTCPTILHNLVDATQFKKNDVEEGAAQSKRLNENVDEEGLESHPDKRVKMDPACASCD